MPISIKPVEKAPIKKYFSEASLLFKLRLSAPVSMYDGMDMISIPKNNISKVLNDEAMETPHKIKNINAKYSETFSPTFSISFPFNKKYKSVQKKVMVLNCKPKLSKCNMPFVSILKNDMPTNSKIFAVNKMMIPATAQYFGIEIFLKKTPPNIIITPQIADIIIAFI